MSNERDFIHDISNQLAIAKISVEVTLESLKARGASEAELTEILDSALNALNTLSQSLAARRREIA